MSAVNSNFHCVYPYSPVVKTFDFKYPEVLLKIKLTTEASKSWRLDSDHLKRFTYLQDKPIYVVQLPGGKGLTIDEDASEESIKKDLSKTVVKVYSSCQASHLNSYTPLDQRRIKAILI